MPISPRQRWLSRTEGGAGPAPAPRDRLTDKLNGKKYELHAAVIDALTVAR